MPGEIAIPPAKEIEGSDSTLQVTAQLGKLKEDLWGVAIAIKEARETHYWLRLLSASDIPSENRIQLLQTEAEGIMKIIGAIVTSSKK